MKNNKTQSRKEIIKELAKKISSVCKSKKIAIEWRYFCEYCGIENNKTFCPIETIAAIIINEQFRRSCFSSKDQEKYHKFALYDMDSTGFIGIINGLDFIFERDLVK